MAIVVCPGCGTKRPAQPFRSNETIYRQCRRCRPYPLTIIRLKFSEMMRRAGVAESVDAGDLKSPADRREGSSPSVGTRHLSFSNDLKRGVYAEDLNFGRVPFFRIKGQRA